MPAGLPRGYSRLVVGRTQAVAADHLAEALREVLRAHTLHAFAAKHPQSRALPGRGIAFAVPMGTERVVVRHNRHGGLLAPITRDLFVTPTRAPLELQLSVRLAEMGIRTPRLLGYAIYPGPLVWRRADVVTREVPESFDLGHALMSPSSEHRMSALTATVALLRSLGASRVRHEDLNVKNVLLSGSPQPDAWLLDLDRVRLQRNDPTRANLDRLIHSARRWQQSRGALVTDGELDSFQASVLGDP